MHLDVHTENKQGRDDIYGRPAYSFDGKVLYRTVPGCSMVDKYTRRPRLFEATCVNNVNNSSTRT